MTESTPQSGRERGVIYTVVIIILIGLAVVALLMFRTDRQNAAADEKATQLVQALETAGMLAPTTDQIARVYGDDGGTACADPNGALTRALVLGELSNGATGPGRRPVIVEDRILKSQLLVIGVYCPDELPNYQEFIDGLDTVNRS
ncbi:hypothetical protein ACLKM7_09905 [Microbacterium sp. I2]|uniref:hypothetical protein n=1 Tax=Microbacterium sp. I2 TaxID=3391826 RepID=UPI003ED86F4F